MAWSWFVATGTLLANMLKISGILWSGVKLASICSPKIGSHGDGVGNLATFSSEMSSLKTIFLNNKVQNLRQKKSKFYPGMYCWVILVILMGSSAFQVIINVCCVFGNISTNMFLYYGNCSF